jgi:leucine efflux protein
MNGISDLGALIAAVLFFLAIPGPGTIKLLTCVGEPKGGFKAGAWGTLGLLTGDLVWMVLALSGVAALAAAYPLAFDTLKIIGALYLAWIGWGLIRATLAHKQVARAAPADSNIQSPVVATEVSRRGPAQWFTEACLVSLSNPKVIGFYVAFFPLFIDRKTFDGLTTYATMVGIVLGIALIYCLFLISLARYAIQLFARRPSLGRWLQRLAGGVLVVFSVKFALQR